MRVGQVPEIVLLQASLIAQPIATNTMTCRVRADQNSSIITVNVEAVSYTHLTLPTKA